MKWRKSPEELVTTFESVMPAAPAVMRNMFGFPAGFIHGNMFMGLHQENMILRLSEESRTELLAIEGAKLFEPMPGDRCVNMWWSHCLLCKTETDSASGSARR